MNYDIDFKSKVDMNKHDMKAEEAIEAVKEGKGFFMQVKEDDEGNKHYFNVYGPTPDEFDHICNIFIDSDSTILLAKAIADGRLKIGNNKERNNKEKTNKYKGFQVTIDYTNKPIMWVLKATEDKINLGVYQRDEMKSFGNPVAENVWNRKGDGTIELLNKSSEEDDLFLYMAVFVFLREHLIAEGLVDKLRDLNKYSGAGILVSAKDEDHITATIVQGKSRPDLPCERFLMGTITCRPYLDEMIAESGISGKGQEDDNKKEDEQQRKAEDEAKAKAKLEAEQKAWEEKAERIKAIREERLAKRLSAIEKNKEQNLKAAEREKDDALSQCENALEETTSAVAEMERELSSLGLLAFRRKSELNKLIEAGKQKVQELASQKKSVIKTYEDKIAEVKKKADTDTQNARPKIEKEHPISISPMEKERRRIEAEEAKIERARLKKIEDEFVKTLSPNRRRVYKWLDDCRDSGDDWLLSEESLGLFSFGKNREIYRSDTKYVLRRLDELGLLEKSIKDGETVYRLK